MASRRELADRALEIAGEDRRLLWALAVNSSPLRRDYFCWVTEFEPRVLVKMLARLANAGVLAPTDGLDFSTVSAGVSAELAERAEQSERRAIHERSLLWPGASDQGWTFRSEHAVGAGHFAEAASLLIDAMTSSESLDDRVVEQLRQTWKGLLSGEAPPELLISCGLRISEAGVGRIRPRELEAIFDEVEGLDLDEHARARLGAAREDHRLDRAGQRAAKKAAKAATAAAERGIEVSEAPPAEARPDEATAAAESSAPAESSAS